MEYSKNLRPLNQDEIDQVSGGFICGGLCMAGVGLGAGALFGSGIAFGWHAAKNK